MELTPFWKSFLSLRRRRKPSQLGDILRRLSEEREAEAKSGTSLGPADETPSGGQELPSPDRELPSADPELAVGEEIGPRPSPG